MANYVTLYVSEDSLTINPMNGEATGINLDDGTDSDDKFYPVEIIKEVIKDLPIEEKNPHAINPNGDPDEDPFTTSHFLTSQGEEASKKIDELSERVKARLEEAITSPYVLMVDPLSVTINREDGIATSSVKFIQVPKSAGRKFFLNTDKDFFSHEKYTMEDVLAMEKENGVV